MNIRDIHQLFVKEGIKADPRNKKLIVKKLKETKANYLKLSRLHKKLFDIDSLTNPYADTKILYGNLTREVKRILVGIDIDVGEILLADRLTQKSKTIDLILAHHPSGIALAGLDDVMGLQTDILQKLGITEPIAKDFMQKRIDEVSRSLHKANHTQSLDAARLLGISLLCCHTPSDNHVVRYLERLFFSQKPRKLKNIIELLLKESEYQEGVRNGSGPRIFIGKEEDDVGKIFVDMTGGTEGCKNIYGRLSQLGIKTIVGMHLSEAHFEKIKGEHMNVIIAGHMASDNLGMNLLLDKLQRRANIEIVECSGFRRFKRNGFYT